MRFCVIFLAFLAISASVGADDVDESDVIVLTKDNFDDIVKASPLMLVEFYAPWCGHCKALTPEFAKAATELKRHDPPIQLAKCDATKHGEISGRFGVSGYPTLFVFRDGKESAYTGPRVADGIVAYMKKQVGPAAKPLTSAKGVEKFITSDPDIGYAVVAFLISGKNSQLASSFQLVSNKLRDKIAFGKVTDPSVAEAFGVSKEDTLIAFKDFDDKKTIYTGKSKTKDVEEWVVSNSLPIVGQWSPAKSNLYMQRDLPIAKLFCPIEPKADSKQNNYYINRLKKAAIQFTNKILVAMVDRKTNEDEMQGLGRKGEKEVLVIQHKGESYMYEGALSADNVLQFFVDYDAGKVSKYVKSERVPQNNDGPVKVVVGKTFEEIVMNPTKDVLIEFYAPWCGHCKALEPKYVELGKKMQKYPDVVIAKIDATANDYGRGKDFDVSGYPTMYLVPAKKGAKPIKYEGDREVKAMAKWLKKKAISIPKKDKKKSKDDL